MFAQSLSLKPAPIDVAGELKRPKQPYSPWLLSCLPVALYFVCFFYFGINAPQFDDFQTVVRAVALLDTATDKLQWLISGYGEHRIAYVRLVAIVVHALTGSIDFMWMGFIGNLSLIGVIGILAVWFKRWQLERYFLPIPFILLQMHYHHNTFTAMMALQNLTILFWALLSLWWATTGRGWRLGAALVVAVIAVYTSGNGILVLGTAILVLLIRRQWPYALGGLVLGGLVLAGYFWDLHSITPSYSPHFMGTHIPQLLTFVVFFCGSYFDLLPNVLMSSLKADTPLWQSAMFGLRLLLPFVMGLLLVAGGWLFVVRWCLNDWLMSRKPDVRWLRRLAQPTSEAFVYRREASTFLAASITFILLSACIVAIGRLEVSLAQSFAIRYKVYAPLLLIMVYAVLLISVRREATRTTLHRVLLVVSVIICANSYVQHLSQIQGNRNTALSGLYTMQVSGTWPVYGAYYGNIDSMMQVAIDKGMYQLDEHRMQPVSTLRSDLQRPCPTISVAFDTTNLVARLQLRQSPVALSLPGAAPNDGAYFVLHDKQRTYLFSAHPDRNVWGMCQSGLSCVIDRTNSMLTPGSYKIALMTYCRGQRRLYNTAYQVKLASR